MTDPFQYLRDEREAKEHQRQERETREKTLEQQEKQLREEAYTQYDPMVTRLLALLRDAAYPWCHITGSLSQYGGGGTWHIQHVDDYYQDRGITFPKTITHVGVDLILDDHLRPIAFECRAMGEKIRCGLTEQELVKALQQLHSPEGASKPRRKRLW